MDYRVVSWDFSSGRTLQELNVQELGGDNQEGAYFVNPPFVQSIHVAEDGRIFAAGLGIKVHISYTYINISFHNKRGWLPARHNRATCIVVGVQNIDTPPTERFSFFALNLCSPPPPPGNFSIPSYFPLKMLAFGTPTTWELQLTLMRWVWTFSGTTHFVDASIPPPPPPPPPPPYPPLPKHTHSCPLCLSGM